MIAESSELQAVHDEIARCNKCGFCQPTCPTFRVSGHEGAVARGRNVLCRNLIEGKTDLVADIQAPLFECLLCRACVVNCFPSVKTDEIMVAARAAYLEKYGQPAIRRFLFHKLLPDPKRMTRYMRFLSFGKRSGLSGLARVTRILGLFGKHVVRADELVESVPSSFLKDRLGVPVVNDDDSETAAHILDTMKPEKVESRVAYFVSCGFNYALPEVGESSLNLLVRNNCEVTIPENCCCGLPPYSYGDLDAAKNLARKNIEVIEALDVDYVVSDCGSCSSFLKEYPRILEKDSKWAPRARTIVEKLRDFSELIQIKKSDLSASLKPLRKRVTYHDPCHLSRYQNLTSEPRTLLQSIPELDFVELPEADWCCGGAGSYNIAHYELSLKILERKIDNVEKTDADIVATSCPSCILQLSYGIRRRGLPIEVLHVSQLLERSAGSAQAADLD